MKVSESNSMESLTTRKQNKGWSELESSRSFSRKIFGTNKSLPKLLLKLHSFFPSIFFLNIGFFSDAAADIQRRRPS